MSSQPRLSISLAAAQVEFSFTELAMPENAEVRRATLARIRNGKLEAAVSRAVGGDAGTLEMFREYQKDLKALLVALEQRDSYQILYHGLLKERQEDYEQRARESKVPDFCSHCQHCHAEFFD